MKQLSQQQATDIAARNRVCGCNSWSTRVARCAAAANREIKGRRSKLTACARTRVCQAEDTRVREAQGRCKESREVRSMLLLLVALVVVVTVLKMKKVMEMEISRVETEASRVMELDIMMKPMMEIEMPMMEIDTLMWCGNGGGEDEDDAYGGEIDDDRVDRK
eukprot:762066-Hanusia_phi.AAC.1